MGYRILFEKRSKPDSKGQFTVEKLNMFHEFSLNWNQFKDYWNVRDHLHNKRGKEIRPSLKVAKKRLRDEGVVLEQPDNSEPNWKWGVDKDRKSFERERLKGIFLYHLKEMSQLCKDYPDYTFIISN